MNHLLCPQFDSILKLGQKIIYKVQKKKENVEQKKKVCTVCSKLKKVQNREFVPDRQIRNLRLHEIKIPEVTKSSSSLNIEPVVVEPPNEGNAKQRIHIEQETAAPEQTILSQYFETGDNNSKREPEGIDTVEEWDLDETLSMIIGSSDDQSFCQEHKNSPKVVDIDLTVAYFESKLQKSFWLMDKLPEITEATHIEGLLEELFPLEDPTGRGSGEIHGTPLFGTVEPYSETNKSVCFRDVSLTISLNVLLKHIVSLLEKCKGFSKKNFPMPYYDGAELRPLQDNEKIEIQDILSEDITVSLPSPLDPIRLNRGDEGVQNKYSFPGRKIMRPTAVIKTKFAGNVKGIKKSPMKKRVTLKSRKGSIANSTNIQKKLKGELNEYLNILKDFNDYSSYHESEDLEDECDELVMFDETNCSNHQFNSEPKSLELEKATAPPVGILIELEDPVDCHEPQDYVLRELSLLCFSFFDQLTDLNGRLSKIDSADPALTEVQNQFHLASKTLEDLQTHWLDAFPPDNIVAKLKDISNVVSRMLFLSQVESNEAAADELWAMEQHDEDINYLCESDSLV